MAWLNTAPRDKKGKPTKTRRERLKADGKSPSSPPIPFAAYLVDYLLDAGTFSTSGMGRTPLSHIEIRAWQQNVGLDLSPWEASTLRILSVEYVASAQAAEEPDCKPPLADAAEVKAMQVADINSKLDQFLD